MTDLRTAAQQALEALEGWDNYGKWVWPESALEQAKRNTTEALSALRATLAQEQAEPVQEHEDWCASVTQLLLSYPPQKAPCNCKKKMAEPAQAPVAYIHRQGNHWEVSERRLDEDERDRGWTEEPLYTAPPQRKPLTEELVTWGVDWGRDGDQSCVSIIKKHADGTIEVVAVEYAPAQRPAEPVQEPVTLKRGLTGRCTRKVCECEKEGLGLECIHLEPMIDGYPLWSGIPKAEPAEEPVAIIQQLWDIIDDIDTYSDVAKADDKLYRLLVERKQKDRWKTGITTDGYKLNIPFYTAPPQRKPLTEEKIDAMWRKAASEEGFTTAQFVRNFVRSVERAHGIT